MCELGPIMVQPGLQFLPGKLVGRQLCPILYPLSTLLDYPTSPNYTFADVKGCAFMVHSWCIKVKRGSSLDMIFWELGNERYYSVIHPNNWGYFSGAARGFLNAFLCAQLPVRTPYCSSSRCSGSCFIGNLL